MAIGYPDLLNSPQAASTSPKLYVRNMPFPANSLASCGLAHACSAPSTTKLRKAIPVVKQKSDYIKKRIETLGGQTDSQVFSQIHAGRNKKKNVSRKTYPVLHGLIGCHNKEWTSLALSWAGWPNGETLASTCAQI